jgi:hypothetical protein
MTGDLLPQGSKATTAGSGLMGLLIWVFALGAYTVGDGYSSSLGPQVGFILLLALFQLMRGVSVGSAGWPLLGVSALLGLHAALTLNSSPCQDLLGKSLISLLLFVALIWSLALLAQAVNSTGRIETVLLCLLLVCTVAVAIHHVQLLRAGRAVHERASGIFPEPSHLALALVPGLVCLVLTGGKVSRVLALLMIGVMLVFSSSSTLIVLLLACFLVGGIALGHVRRVGSLLLKVLFPLATVVGLVWLTPYRDEVLSRVEGLQIADVGANASSIIYVMGWQYAQANVESTSGLGLGFNRMGCAPRPVTPITDAIDALGLDEANNNDGSFTVSKVLSELGIGGGVTWVAMGLVFIGQLRRMARRPFDASTPLMVLMAGAVTVLLFGGFVRGTGFFSGPFLMGVFALLLLHRLLRNAPERLR